MHETLKAKTGTLFSTVVIADLTWVTNIGTVAGALAAIIGLVAAVMLVAIRWHDFLASDPIKAFRKWVNSK